MGDRSVNNNISSNPTKRIPPASAEDISWGDSVMKVTNQPPLFPSCRITNKYFLAIVSECEDLTPNICIKRGALLLTNEMMSGSSNLITAMQFLEMPAQGRVALMVTDAIDTSRHRYRSDHRLK
ncbi:hypothetical protein NPIL_371071 [Nephila pilipes]|uniref:Uncharacterized protein n=1 Tax=Nephila pilipes TaxID=299642 RepID=A0A8X6NJB4_NEPPI|nr:hypothetical protein NPIL_371071 [Nephila pilipes]